jgi:hypothetical protein
MLRILSVRFFSSTQVAAAILAPILQAYHISVCSAHRIASSFPALLYPGQPYRQLTACCYLSICPVLLQAAKAASSSDDDSSEDDSSEEEEKPAAKPAAAAAAKKADSDSSDEESSDDDSSEEEAKPAAAAKKAAPAKKVGCVYLALALHAPACACAALLEAWSDTAVLLSVLLHCRAADDTTSLVMTGDEWRCGRAASHQVVSTSQMHACCCPPTSMPCR